ncbi:MAG: pyruvate kinase [Anaerolineaceae bacterium]|nr:pyruvate kinase [Anaerolineaceae bacterium]
MASAIRFTKIVATAGPATEADDRLRSLFGAGCNVIRLNASHGTAQWRERTLAQVRRIAKEMGLFVGVLLDLSGPKIRIDQLSSDPLQLEVGGTVTIAGRELPAGGAALATTWPAIVADCQRGEKILLDDGALRLVVEESGHGQLLCRVEVGGLLQMHKGVNLPGTAISAPALTAKDDRDLAWGLAAGVDYVGLSFVRRPEDIIELRRRIDQADSRARIVAKIEKPQAVEHIEKIIELSDAVMVARGDLGVEMDVAQVPLVQKRITRLAVEAGKPVIIATQMLQSMIRAPQPTRAEVSDIANAILDGTDAIMLSGETAVGDYPVEAVAVMDRIANLTENHEREFAGWAAGGRGATSGWDDTDSGGASESFRAETALADGAARIAMDIGARAIVVLTHSGATALAVSKQRPEAPIVAITDRLDTCRRMALYRGRVCRFPQRDHQLR